MKDGALHPVSAARDEEGEVGRVSADSEVVHTQRFHIYISTL